MRRDARRLKSIDAPVASFAPIFPLAAEPGAVSLFLNRWEIDELSKLQRSAREGKDGVVVVRFTLEDVADHLSNDPLAPYQGPRERRLLLEAWALAFEAAAARLRRKGPVPAFRRKKRGA